MMIASGITTRLLSLNNGGIRVDASARGLFDIHSFADGKSGK